MRLPLLAFFLSLHPTFIRFVGLVGFGLLHGMIFLPVLLSLIGPSDDPSDAICALGNRKYPSIDDFLKRKCGFDGRDAKAFAKLLRVSAGVRDVRELALSTAEEVRGCGLQIAQARWVVFEAREMTGITPDEVGRIQRQGIAGYKIDQGGS